MRYNIFNKAHLPLKKALIDACISMNNVLEKGPSETAEAVKKVEEVLFVFNEQVTYETLHILPFIFEYEPSVWNNYNADHDKALGLAKKIKEGLQGYYKQKKGADKLNALNFLSESLNEFTLFNFNHMDDEEAVLNEILWRYYTDFSLLQLEEKIEILPHRVKPYEQRTRFQTATAA